MKEEFCKGCIFLEGYYCTLEKRYIDKVTECDNHIDEED